MHIGHENIIASNAAGMTVKLVLFVFIFGFCSISSLFEWEIDDNFEIFFEANVVDEISREFRLFIEQSFSTGASYPRGILLSRTIVTSAGFSFTITLYIGSTRGDTTFCATNPDPTDVELGGVIARSFRDLLRKSLPVMRQYRSTTFMGVDDLEMILYSYQATRRTGSFSFAAKHVFPNVSIAARDSCEMFRTFLVSGYMGMPRTYTKVLFSPSQRYFIQVMSGCYFGLFIRAGNSNFQVWRNEQQHPDKPGHDDCMLHLQQDGNLVLLDGEEVQWAANKYCEPQPNCAEPSFAALQDDCNFVLYRSPGQVSQPTAVWNSNTVHCRL